MADMNFQEHTLYFNNKSVIFRVPSRYQQLTIRGEGTFGTVCACVDTSKRDERGYPPGRAIKKFKDPFKEPTKAKRVLREILILHYFTHDKVIKLLDVFYEPKYGEVYMVIELMKTDLNQIIQNVNYPNHFICYVMYQICHAMAYIHSANILHRDLKPGNILINNDASLRVCDLGLAVKEHTGMSVYVVTRYYRAPELLFKNPSSVRFADYGAAVDMWSVGCILAELYLKRPLFPGEHYFDQLKRILEIVGLPDQRLLSKMQPISSKAVKVMQEVQQRPRVQWHHIIPNMSPDGYDLLDKLLTLDPEKRLTAQQAIQHPFFAKIYKPTHLRTHDQRLEFNHERDDLTSHDYREYMIQTIDSINSKKKPFGTELYNQMQKFVNTPLAQSTTSSSSFEPSYYPTPNPTNDPLMFDATAPHQRPIYDHHQHMHPMANFLPFYRHPVRHLYQDQYTPQSTNPESVNPSQPPSSINPHSVNPSRLPPSVNPQSVNPNSVNPQSVNPQSVNPQSVNPMQPPFRQQPSMQSPLVSSSSSSSMMPRHPYSMMMPPLLYPPPPMGDHPFFRPPHHGPL